MIAPCEKCGYEHAEYIVGFFQLCPRCSYPDDQETANYLCEKCNLVWNYYRNYVAVGGTCRVRYSNKTYCDGKLWIVPNNVTWETD